MVALIKTLCYLGLVLAMIGLGATLMSGSATTRSNEESVPMLERRTSDDFQLYNGPKTVQLQLSLNGYAPDVVYAINGDRIHPLLECYNLFNCTHTIGETDTKITWIIKHTGMNCETSYTSLNPQNINEPIRLMRGDCND